VRGLVSGSSARTHGNDDGYAYRLLLVAVPDDDELHLAPVVEDVVWMRRLADAGLIAIQSEPWPHVRIFETRPDRTICGAEMLGPFDHPERPDEPCIACMAETLGCFDDGVQRLAARWVEHWPDLPREIALAEYQARRA
jgi:hypothetical protein